MSNNPSQKPEWTALSHHKAELENFILNDAFEKDKARFDKLSARINGLLFDFSKQKVTEETVNLLVKLADACDFEKRRNDMFSGKAINHTENRAVLHTALRNAEKVEDDIEGENISEFIEATSKRMEAFCKDVHSGAHKGYTGKAIKHIVNIGIGGSDLGPRLVVNALAPFQKENINSYFVANIDGADLDTVLKEIDPETALFLVASKTFTTQETLANAQGAKNWLIEKLGSEESVARHFVALSTNVEGANTFGIETDFVFPFGNWVGGRFSLWSSIGLSIMLALGVGNFKHLLSGAAFMDEHFCSAPLHENIPVLLGMIGIWNRNFQDYDSLAVLPYAQNLAELPLFLQQLEMESNGKQVDRDSVAITDYKTCPVLFGQAGTNGQHAFYQLLHQGTDIIPCDFIGFQIAQHAYDHHHTLLNNNMIAQSQALMKGRTLEQANGDPNRVFKGNRPSSTLVLKTLDPYHLGMLIALYEHKVFVQGVIWNINSFDQFGVELGKEMAKNIEQGHSESADASTSGLLKHIHAKS